MTSFSTIFFKRLFLRQIATIRLHTIKYQRFFPQDSKTDLGSEIGPLGTELCFFQHHFFQSLIFMSNRHHTSTYHKISITDFFPKDSKTALGFEIGPLGTELWLFQHHFFQALIFKSNRRGTSTYYKISIKDFFPRIPKLPSDLKLVHWGPSYGSSSTIFFKRSFLCQIATIPVRIIKYQSKIFSRGFQNCPRI